VTRIGDACPGDHRSIPVRNKMFISSGKRTDGPEYRLSLFENRVLRRVFGPKRYGVTGEWRKLQNEEPNDLYWSPSIVRVIK
jgi:hypothetical protein